MTELPRGTFPLVVPPPGGFEEAVRRGRGIRRRRAGGSTGAALVLVGALAYSVMGGPNGTSGLQPARPIGGADASERPGDPSYSPEPTASPTDATPSSTAAPNPGSNPYVPPAPIPSVGVPATRPPGGLTDQEFAPRSAIVEYEAAAGTATNCLEKATDKWCTFANVETVQSAETYYILKFSACRSVDADTQGEIAFDRKQEVEFVVSRVENSERIWTYSRGVPVEAASSKTSVMAGWCVQWTTNWNGYDDWGFDPGGGEYRLEAWSTGTSDGPLEHAYSETFSI